MNYKRLIISLALPLLAGFLGSFFTAPAIGTWYAELAKPSFNPPGWIFGPVWTMLYILMGISVYLIWQQVKKNSQTKPALWIFWIHLVFNAGWSIIFFGLHNPAWAFVNILILLAMILTLVVLFARINKWAALLLIPYLLWVSFASILNYSIWSLNQEPNIIACTMEAKLCSDGTSVGRQGPDCTFTLCPKEDLIQVESPQANQMVSSPLLVKGQARGNWFFEASFPIKIIDQNGDLILQSYIMTSEDWMTDQFVTFEKTFEFTAPASGSGFLILEKDNPSGLAEFADELRIPITFR